ncbi:hypothetical protein [Corynebacterium variabile]|uniref:hypothetical protein n=1 Tax=Corynebacterium variabile TaxID=1727 RepID=UPI0028A70F87|nr:hypothetical protein [Corynebacterium variabile]
MPRPTPPWLTAEQDIILTEQGHTYAAMILSNDALGEYGTRDKLITHLITHRPELIHGVLLRLLDLIGGGPDDAD